MDELREKIEKSLFASIILVATREEGTIIDLDSLIIDRQKAIDGLASFFTEYAADIERRARDEATNKVNRLEVIDRTGRAYVKGSIYDRPVEVTLSYQDDGRTLKVFVTDRSEQLRAERKES